MTSSAKSRQSIDVLVVGAGPTGLVLALWLKHMGASVRIVDKTAEPGTTSRALAVQARTLELYGQLDLARAVVEGGRRIEAVNMWVAGRQRARAVFGDIGEGISPYGFPLIYPQDEHERLLIDRLARAGVEVERQIELLGFEEKADRVIARLGGPGGAVETCEATYLAGCDGAHSTVRQSLGIGFPGGVYSHLFYVADVEASSVAMNGEIHVALEETDFMVLFPLKGERRARLIGTVRDEAAARHESLSWNDVSGGVIERMRVEVERVNWFSTYRVHHRVADRFGRGRAFLLGDAAHIHSPVGGQGMNTGIGDAINLAWKLAAVLERRADRSILDTYEPERIAFARRLVSTTDRAFTAVTSNRPLARWVRLEVVPLVLARLFSIVAVRRFLFRTVSQTAVTYRGSGLSEGRAGQVAGGDRLPWVKSGDGQPGDDNFAPLAALAWQVHVYGDARAAVQTLCRLRRLPLHVFPWRREMSTAGLRASAVYLVRPDAYVALADASARAETLASYLDARGIVMPA